MKSVSIYIKTKPLNPYPSVKEPDELTQFGVPAKSLANLIQRLPARGIVPAGYAEQCEVQTAYAIGMEKPVSVNVDCFGTEFQPLDFIRAYVGDSCDLTPSGIIRRLHLLNVDYNLVSSYGHFGKPGLPWKKSCQRLCISS